MPALVRTWSGDEWQEYVEQLLLRRYLPGDYQIVPDRYRGDLGVEGFSISDACAYQCYACEGLPTPAEVYEKQRAKLSADIKKFIKNRSGLANVFGTLLIRRWNLVVPVFDDRRLVAHAVTKTAEVINANLPYVHPDFRVVVVTDDAFGVERRSLTSAGLIEIRVDMPPSPVEEVSLWSTDRSNSMLVSTLEGKGTRVVSSAASLPAFVSEMLHNYLNGQALLGHLHDYFPEAHRQAMECKRAREQILRMQSLTGDTTARLGSHVDAYRAELQATVRGLSAPDATKLSLEAIADWLMRCPLDFPSPGQAAG
jgi:hypothetical protein